MRHRASMLGAVPDDFGCETDRRPMRTTAGESGHVQRSHEAHRRMHYGRFLPWQMTAMVDYGIPHGHFVCAHGESVSGCRARMRGVKSWGTDGGARNVRVHASDGRGDGASWNGSSAPSGSIRFAATSAAIGSCASHGVPVSRRRGAGCDARRAPRRVDSLAEGVHHRAAAG